MRTIKNFHLSCVVRKELYGLYKEEESSMGVFDFKKKIKIVLRRVFLARHIVECIIV